MKNASSNKGMKDPTHILETTQRVTPSHSFYDSVLKITIDSPKVIPLQWLQAAAVIAVILIATEIAIVNDALTVDHNVSEIISLNDNSLYND